MWFNVSSRVRWYSNRMLVMLRMRVSASLVGLGHRWPSVTEGLPSYPQPIYMGCSDLLE